MYVERGRDERERVGGRERERKNVWRLYIKRRRLGESVFWVGLLRMTLTYLRFIGRRNFPRTCHYKQIFLFVYLSLCLSVSIYLLLFWSVCHYLKYACLCPSTYFSVCRCFTVLGNVCLYFICLCISIFSSLYLFVTIWSMLVCICLPISLSAFVSLSLGMFVLHFYLFISLPLFVCLSISIYHLIF